MFFLRQIEKMQIYFSLQAVEIFTAFQFSICAWQDDISAHLN